MLKPRAFTVLASVKSETVSLWACARVSDMCAVFLLPHRQKIVMEQVKQREKIGVSTVKIPILRYRGILLIREVITSLREKAIRILAAHDNLPLLHLLRVP